MSYSFAAKGGTKGLALEDAEQKFKAVIASQPAHQLDEALARKHREEVIAMVGEAPEGSDVYLSCSGSVSWTGTFPGDHKVVGVSCSVSVGYIAKEEPKAN